MISISPWKVIIAARPYLGSSILDIYSGAFEFLKGRLSPSTVRSLVDPPFLEAWTLYVWSLFWIRNFPSISNESAMSLT